MAGVDALELSTEDDLADALLTSSPLETWRAQRYASFDSGAGADFANGTSTLADLAKYAAGKGEQVTIIGVDGNSDAVKSIKEGRLNASVAVFDIRKTNVLTRDPANGNFSVAAGEVRIRTLARL